MSDVEPGVETNVETNVEKPLMPDSSETVSEPLTNQEAGLSDSSAAGDFRQFDESHGFDLKAIIEGALFASGKPLTIKQLQALFGEEAPPEAGVLESLLLEIGQDYSGRGVVLNKVASGYRFQVSKNIGPWVSKLWEEKPVRYSRALLETLALVAYRQPVTRGEIEDIRGVSVSSHIIKTLLEREWVRVVGHKEVPGRPAMYATTRAFLDYFNLVNLDELPTLPEIQALDPNNPIPLDSQEEVTQERAVAESSDDGADESADENTYESVGEIADESTGDNNVLTTEHDLSARPDDCSSTEEGLSSGASAERQQGIAVEREPVAESGTTIEEI